MSYPNPFSDQFGTSSDFMNESHQQLSPTTGYPQWETIERGEQQQQHHQIESPLDSTTPTGPTPLAFRSINLDMDDMSSNIMSSQTTTPQIDNSPIHLHHPHTIHQQLHHHQQMQQQQEQFHHHQQQQYHRQQSRHLSLEPFATQISRPGSSSQHHVTTSPIDTFPPQSTTPLTPNPNPPTESAPSTSNPTGGRHSSRKTSGPIRSSTRATRAQQQAPYFRPSPASTTASYLGLEVPRAGSSASSTPRIPQQTEPQQRKQTIRFTATPDPIRTRAASRAAASSMMPSPIPECEASATTPGQTEIAFSPMTRRSSRARSTTTQTQTPQQPTDIHTQSPPQANPIPQPQPQTQPLPPQAFSAATRSYRRRHPLNITSDMHYSQSSNILHASLELPGVKKQDVQMKLATCYFNHVKFISVHAETAPVFDLPTGLSGGGEQVQDTSSSGTKQTPSQTSISINADLRERRFGSLKRIIQVPSTTKLEDIDASMEDGVLSLKIYCGKPYELDDEQTILIR